MNNRFFKITKTFKSQINEDFIPKRSTIFSAGYDIKAVGDYTIKLNELKIIHTGIKVSMPSDECLLVFLRSSMAKHGLILANGVAVIDSDYYSNPENDGEILLPIFNISGKNSVTINHGMRIAQGVFIKYFLTKDDNCINKRNGGFGSTGQ